MQPHLSIVVALAALSAGLLGSCGPAPAPPGAAVSPPSVPSVPAIPAIRPIPAPAVPSAAAPAAPLPAAEVPAVAGGAPADVAAFRRERDECDHFRGEEPYDAKRAAELKTQLLKFCKGTDTRLAGLRKKYAGQPAVLATLKDYEERIE